MHFILNLYSNIIRHPLDLHFLFFYFFKYLFTYSFRESEERGRDTGRGRSRLHAQSPMWDLILVSRIMPWAELLSHTGCPRNILIKNVNLLYPLILLRGKWRTREMKPYHGPTHNAISRMNIQICSAFFLSVPHNLH